VAAVKCVNIALLADGILDANPHTQQTGKMKCLTVLHQGWANGGTMRSIGG